MFERVSSVLPNPEFPIGSPVPILEHSNKLGLSCPGLEGSVTELDERNRPKKATCDVKGCGKIVPINWARVQSNREAIAEAKAAKKRTFSRAKKTAR